MLWAATCPTCQIYLTRSLHQTVTYLKTVDAKLVKAEILLFQSGVDAGKWTFLRPGPLEGHRTGVQHASTCRVSLLPVSMLAALDASATLQLPGRNFGATVTEPPAHSMSKCWAVQTAPITIKSCRKQLRQTYPAKICRARTSRRAGH